MRMGGGWARTGAGGGRKWGGCGWIQHWAHGRHLASPPHNRMNYLLAGVVVAMVLMRSPLGAKIRAYIYDAVISHTLTTSWYKCVLDEVPQGAAIMDVGIGTAAALCNNKTTIVKKDLTVVGIDYDADYIARAESLVAQSDLKSKVRVLHRSVYDKPLPPPLKEQSGSKGGSEGALAFRGVAHLHEFTNDMRSRQTGNSTPFTSLGALCSCQILLAPCVRSGAHPPRAPCPMAVQVHSATARADTVVLSQVAEVLRPESGLIYVTQVGMPPRSRCVRQNCPTPCAALTADLPSPVRSFPRRLQTPHEVGLI